MKPKTLFFLALFPLWGLGGCSNDDTPKTLPPATQTGEGIFACLVNGEVFVHEDGLINCYYQYVDGGYYFRVSGQKENSDQLFSIRLATDQKEIAEGGTYQLMERINGNAWGGALV